MDINGDLVRKIAEVARLKLSDQEVEEFTPQLKEVLESFQKLDKLNTENTKPSFQPVSIRNKLREDKPAQPLSQEKALKNAKHKKDGYFKGPSAV